MNYYQRYIGDYMRDAGHLSMLEHGAYTQLLDFFYATEKPIPNNEDKYQIIGARTKQEKAATDKVLSNFFVLKKTGWVNKRAQQEMKKMRAKILLAKSNGEKGGRPNFKNLESLFAEKNLNVRKPSSNKAETITDSKPNPNRVGFKKKPNPNPTLTQPKAIYKLQTTNIKRKKQTKKEKMADEVFVALTRQGFRLVAQSRTKISEFLKKDATIDDFMAASRIARNNEKGLPYLFGIVEKKLLNSSPKSRSAHTKNIGEGVNDDGSF
jgi:uncharacterized protein YdaU (DUF1376 family)